MANSTNLGNSAEGYSVFAIEKPNRVCYLIKSGGRPVYGFGSDEMLSPQEAVEVYLQRTKK